MYNNSSLPPGVASAEKGDTLIAMMEFQKIERHTPLTRSYYAYVIARERGEFNKALTLCRESIREDPQNNTHYLNLGRVFLAAGRRDQAIKTFRKGLKLGHNAKIKRHLDQLGARRPEIFPALSRNNPLNKYFGLLFARVGLR
ncbi:MAG: hypothetical protein C0624_00655 [Desulfuromonas sp.]|nr:MAG: hypothetical protein C0624_00655 [Desulfuromonas sp.]